MGDRRRSGSWAHFCKGPIVIADLAVNHVERQVLLCGFTIERIVHDYGIDVLMFTFDRNGETEPIWPAVNKGGARLP